MSSRPSVTLYTASAEGHRGEYTRVLSSALSCRFSCRSTRSLLELMSPRLTSVFFEMLDDRAPSFLVLALIRSLLGLRTSGLFFRSGECFRPGLKYKIKQALFRALRLLPGVTVLTILPFQIDPRFALVAHGWIYDPQLWDLPILTEEKRENRIAEFNIREPAAGRKVIVALGGQERIKGFEFFCQIWLGSAELRERYMFAVAGRIPPGYGELLSRFEEAGGLAFNSFVTEDELRHAYAQADAVWCCYAPDYDQSSGIFGRSFQLGVPAIVREGSYVQQLSSLLDHDQVALTFGEVDLSVAVLLRSEFERADQVEIQKKVEALRDVSLANLERSIA